MFITFRLFKLSIKSDSKYIKEIDNELYERNTDIYNLTDSYSHFFRVYMVITDDFIQFVKKKEEMVDPEKKFAFIERLNQKILNQDKVNPNESKREHGGQINNHFMNKGEETQGVNDKMNQYDAFARNNGSNEKSKEQNVRGSSINMFDQDSMAERERVLLVLPNIFDLFFSMSRITRLITMNDMKLKFYTEQECKLAFDHLNTQFCKVNKRNDHVFNEQYKNIREMYKKELKGTNKTWNELKRDINRISRKDI